ncbi:MAG: hypothetical protein WCO00_08115 [Rhodospirillaceae bacterium]
MISRNRRADPWASPKHAASGPPVGADPLAPFSYGAMLVVGSLLGFGVLVGLESPRRVAVVAEVKALSRDSRAGSDSHAHPAAPPAAPVPAPAETHAAAHPPAHGSAGAAASHHEAGAAPHEADPAEEARKRVRETFTEKFLVRFLSPACDKNPHSETGVQFGPSSYTEFTGGKRSRTIEGEYRFGTDGFSLIVDETNRLDFRITADMLSMVGVMVAGVSVPVPPAPAWKACRSDAHEPPLQPPRPRPFDASDGLRLALLANDMEAATHYLALGGYIATADFPGVMKEANLEGPIGAPIREASKLNEDNALRRKAELDRIEARQKAAEARHALAAKSAPAKPKPKDKPKEGGGH